jgi:hypothetical protein
VNKTVYTFINTDKNTKLGDVFYLTLDGGPDGIIFSDTIPRIRFKLLNAQRNPLFCRIDIQDHDLQVISDLQDLRRMVNFFGP